MDRSLCVESLWISPNFQTNLDFLLVPGGLCGNKGFEKAGAETQHDKTYLKAGSL